MLAFLQGLWAWRLEVAILLVAITIGWYRHLADYRLDQLHEARLATGLAQEALERAQDSAAAQIGAMKITMEETDERNEYLQGQLDRIGRARGTKEDGPVAPVLRDTLDGLRARHAAPARGKALRHRSKPDRVPGAGTDPAAAKPGGRGRGAAAHLCGLGGLLEEVEPHSGHYRCVMLALKPGSSLVSL